MSEAAAQVNSSAGGLLELYDRALGDVYGYLVARCGDPATAEDLTSETFMAAVDAVNRGTADLNVAWLIGIARHKLLDHWRRAARDERRLAAIAGALDESDDPWDDHIDVLRTRDLLDRLGAHHRSALALRYLDGLPVPEVARHLERTVDATEALLVRARRALRAVYEGSDDGD